ncbi:c-type cytochrome [Roseovarius sp. EL26]|uniref:c-type cytochrome n=1 Tax=Roseovarius sp. EL26 TaxID=2126672 RepID=UPI000EA1FE41|nr:c-type cytochrome [Roseovarius sp. EL26]
MHKIAGAFLFWLMATTASAQEFTTLKGHGGPVMDIAIHPETGRVATASFDNSIGLWLGRVPEWLEGHEAAVTTVRFIDENLLMSGGDDFRALLWAPGEFGPLQIVKHKGKITDVAFWSEGGLLATASWDGTIEVRRAMDLQRNNEIIDPAYANSVSLTGHDAGINAVAFTPDGDVYSASTDGTIRFWDVSFEGVSSRIITENGFGINKMIVNARAGWLAYGAVDGVTRVIDPISGEILHDFTLERRPILSMAYHAGTDQLAVGDGQGYIMIIDTSAWEIIRDFRSMRRGPVWALAFSPDGAKIYAGGIEDIVYAWPVALLDTFDPAGGATRSFLQDPAKMSNGERQFMRKCSICHALTPPPSRKAGPTLYNVMGRRAGTVSGYNYSETLQGSDIVWSDDTINALFDEGPDHYIPGSKMPMQRITETQDRQDLIDFLRGATMADIEQDIGVNAGSQEDRK